MKNQGYCIALYKTVEAAEKVFSALEQTRFDLCTVSVAGKQPLREEQIFGYCHDAGQVKCWGRLSPFWNRALDRLSGFAFYIVSNEGLIIVVGPLVSTMMRGLKEGPEAKYSPIRVALSRIGVSSGNVDLYESMLNANAFLILEQGTQDEIHRVHDLLMHHDAMDVTIHYG